MCGSDLHLLGSCALATVLLCVPRSDYTVDVLRGSLLCNSLGNKYHSRNFCAEVTSLGAEVVDEIQANLHGEVLPALGVPRDLDITGDGVSIHKTKSAPHGKRNLIFIGTLPSHHATGKTVVACLDVSNHGVGLSRCRARAILTLYFLFVWVRNVSFVLIAVLLVVVDLERGSITIFRGIVFSFRACVFAHQLRHRLAWFGDIRSLCAAFGCPAFQYDTGVVICPRCSFPW